jgi:hypothetical protein
VTAASRSTPAEDILGHVNIDVTHAVPSISSIAPSRKILLDCGSSENAC